MYYRLKVQVNINKDDVIEPIPTERDFPNLAITFMLTILIFIYKAQQSSLELRTINAEIYFDQSAGL